MEKTHKRGGVRHGADGNVITGRKRIPEAKKKVIISVSVDPELKVKLDEMPGKLTEKIEKILKEYFNK